MRLPLPTMTQPPRTAQPQIQVERREAPSNVEEPTMNLKADVVPDQRFTLSVDVRRDADRAGFKGRGP